MNALRISSAAETSTLNAAAERSTALTLVRRNLLATRSNSAANSNSVNSLANSSTYLSRPVDSYTWSMAVATYGAQGSATGTAVEAAYQSSQSHEGESYVGEYDALFSYSPGRSQQAGAAAQYGFYASLSASTTRHTVDLYA
jgi:hypothetical protein